MIHELKTLPEYFEAVFMGKKNFEIRQDLEVEVLFEKTTLTENDGWLLVNNSTDKWLMICELELLS